MVTSELPPTLCDLCAARGLQSSTEYSARIETVVRLMTQHTEGGIWKSPEDPSIKVDKHAMLHAFDSIHGGEQEER